MLASLHPEDIKAALRKEYGSVREFEKAQGLPDKSVHEIFRGRGSRRVMAAVEAALDGKIPDHAEKPSSRKKAAHRLNKRAA